ncbi:Uncharacterised protein [Mycobacterium tuberculosis]|nr:Uncharacterised protein [Mycobacterium tuberculosis]
MIWSSPVVSTPDQVKCNSLLGNRSRTTFQRSTSCSCSEFHWSHLSLSGNLSLSQYHCRIAASSSVVGVSALYSNSTAGRRPS